MWEEYLRLATADVRDKYQARRLKAKIRSRILTLRQRYIDQGHEPEHAMAMALETLGDPRQLGHEMALPLRQQHGWLWLISFAQLVFGLGLIVVSWKTQTLASLALGRIDALWGIVATGIHTLRIRDVRHHLRVLQKRHHDFHRLRFWRLLGLSAAAGVLSACVSSLPWNFVTANVFHPVLVSSASALTLALTVSWLPWAIGWRWVGLRMYWVTWQAWAALVAALAYTATVQWNQWFAPPPLFNWSPLLVFAGSWLFYFMALRVLAALRLLRKRVLVGWDDDEF
jgi:MFS family permease